MWWYAVMPAHSSDGRRCMYAQSKSAFSRKSFFTPFWIGDMPRPWLCASTSPGISSCLPFPRTREPGFCVFNSSKAPTDLMRSPSIAIAPSRTTPLSFLRGSVRTYLPRMIHTCAIVAPQSLGFLQNTGDARRFALPGHHAEPAGLVARLFQSRDRKDPAARPVAAANHSRRKARCDRARREAVLRSAPVGNGIGALRDLSRPVPAIPGRPRARIRAAGDGSQHANAYQFAVLPPLRLGRRARQLVGAKHPPALG